MFIKYKKAPKAVLRRYRNVRVPLSLLPLRVNYDKNLSICIACANEKKQVLKPLLLALEIDIIEVKEVMEDVMFFVWCENCIECNRDYIDYMTKACELLYQSVSKDD